MRKGVRSRKRRWNFDSATNLWEIGEGAPRGDGTFTVLLIYGKRGKEQKEEVELCYCY